MYNLSRILVNWSFGTLNPEHADKLECEMLSDVEDPKKIIAVLASDNKGHSFLSKRDDPYYCNRFIAIRNKKTNEVSELFSFVMNKPFRSIEIISTCSHFDNVIDPLFRNRPIPNVTVLCYGKKQI